MQDTRRRFIGAASAAVAGVMAQGTAARTQPPDAPPPAARHSSFDPWVEVHAGHLRHNVAEIARHVQGRPIAIGRMHAVSSYGLFQRPDGLFDMVRPGMAVFGVYPEASFRTAGLLDLRCALALRARVIYVKQLAAGETAGYNRAYVARTPVWVATLPVGHADGWPRVAANAASVRIGEYLYPVVASVSASHTIVEIGPEPRVQIGDVATLFDWREGSRPEDVSAACRASVYDLTMHLNPLLPRRVLDPVAPEPSP